MTEETQLADDLTPEQARDYLWRSGNIAELLLDNLQKKMIDGYRGSANESEITFVLSRQTGKSYGFGVLAIEECIRRPEIVVLYIAPTLKMAKRILKNNFNQILKTCPKDMRPVFKTQDSEYLFPNGSRIILCGFNAGEIEGVRGNTAHIVMLDECGFMDEAEFEYGINSVAYPTLNVTKGTMMMCSTLPKSATHPYWSRVLKARMENRCIEGTIYDCPRYTQDDIDKFAKRVGGYDSIDFRREYLNEMITDEERAVIPEATKERMANMTKVMNRPPHFDSYVAMDIGFRDYTAIIFGYYDFLKNKVVIEDEVVLKGVRVTTATICDEMKKKESLHWGHKKPHLRIADNNNLILLNELSQPPYNLPILPTAKDNREAAINKLRLLVQKEQLVIHPRCVQLLQHIQHATWNKKRSEFDRDPINGHFDLLAALIYFVRNVQFGKNPYPQEWLMTHESFSIEGMGGNQPKNEFEKAMVELFNPLKKKR